ncbi:hypothetical protein K9L05_04205 [Candidatus Babeliales bacterium]|nr:hypothetical protein [Candidatus Babeliales bacterium]
MKFNDNNNTKDLHKKEIDELNTKKHKKSGFYSKLKQMKVKVKSYLKSFFPRRVKATDQENKKGPRF